MFCLSAEPPFARSAGNEGKVAFCPGRWKGLSRGKSSVFRQKCSLGRKRWCARAEGRTCYVVGSRMDAKRDAAAMLLRMARRSALIATRRREPTVDRSKRRDSNVPPLFVLPPAKKSGRLCCVPLLADRRPDTGGRDPV